MTARPIGEHTASVEGQQVEITLKKVTSEQPWDEELHRCAGALATDWTEDDDRILAEIYRDRSIPTSARLVSRTSES